MVWWQFFFLAGYSQSDYISIGIVHGDGDGVFLILVFGIVVCSSLQEETDQPAESKRHKGFRECAQQQKLKESYYAFFVFYER